uniref:IS1 transposase n=1 Tax=Candidatus Methanogaster sp. ANME-2c ERB4 TaxID=2759911 RepID=A0A7G9Y360_9EURY|nr:hypothetical protein NGDELHHK_00002 [Methanosarcinales archaeon ANME-2c ERB4]QNO42444.1 hypothetical protein PKPANOHO_00001 [Methanosarcinales archaeon ANME-2c ERB4]
MLFVRTHNAIIIEKKLGKTLSKAVSTIAPAIKGITASIARLISWKRKVRRYIENNCPKRTLYGNPDPGDIETTDVKNHNGIIRERSDRLVRKTKCFSKRRRMLECPLQVFQFYWNFINGFKRRTSPAMLEGSADHLWTWHKFFYFQVTILD